MLHLLHIPSLSSQMWIIIMDAKETSLIAIFIC